MDEPTKSKKELELGRIPNLHRKVSVRETKDLQIVLCLGTYFMSITEEPYEGNPQVRFREGEQNYNNGMHLFRHET